MVFIILFKQEDKIGFIYNEDQDSVVSEPEHQISISVNIRLHLYVVTVCIHKFMLEIFIGIKDQKERIATLHFVLFINVNSNMLLHEFQLNLVLHWICLHVRCVYCSLHRNFRGDRSWITFLLKMCTDPITSIYQLMKTWPKVRCWQSTEQ